MQVTVSSVSGQPYRQAISMRNHTIYADVDATNGGKDTAPNPHEILLAAVGACTSMTLQMFAKRKAWDLQSISVSLNEDQVTPPGQSTAVPRITKTISVQGNLTAQQLQDLKTVAEKCPVNKLFMSSTKQMDSNINLIV